MSPFSQAGSSPPSCPQALSAQDRESIDSAFRSRGMDMVALVAKVRLRGHGRQEGWCWGLCDE